MESRLKFFRTYGQFFTNLIVLNLLINLDNVRSLAPQIKNLNVQCDADGMRVDVTFDSPFNGIVFSKGFYNDMGCRYIQEKSDSSSVNFKIPADRCGTSTVRTDSKDSKQYENVIIFQNDPIYQEVWDSARLLSCRYLLERDLPLQEKRVVFKPFVVDMLDVLTVPMADFAGDQHKVDCWMDVTKGRYPNNSPIDGPVKVGENLTLAIYIRDSRKRTDIRVKDCYAYDNEESVNDKSPALLQLSGEDGCPLKPKLMDVWKRTAITGNTEASVLAYSTVTAFKFPEHSNVHLTCNVELCKNQCSDRCSLEAKAIEGLKEGEMGEGGDEEDDKKVRPVIIEDGDDEDGVETDEGADVKPTSGSASPKRDPKKSDDEDADEGDEDEVKSSSSPAAPVTSSTTASSVDEDGDEDTETETSSKASTGLESGSSTKEADEDDADSDGTKEGGERGGRKSSEVDLSNEDDEKDEETSVGSSSTTSTTTSTTTAKPDDDEDEDEDEKSETSSSSTTTTTEKSSVRSEDDDEESDAEADEESDSSRKRSLRPSKKDDEEDNDDDTGSFRSSISSSSSAKKSLKPKAVADDEDYDDFQSSRGSSASVSTTTTTPIPKTPLIIVIKPEKSRKKIKEASTSRTGGRIESRSRQAVRSSSSKLTSARSSRDSCCSDVTSTSPRSSRQTAVSRTSTTTTLSPITGRSAVRSVRRSSRFDEPETRLKATGKRSKSQRSGLTERNKKQLKSSASTSSAVVSSTKKPTTTTTTTKRPRRRSTTTTTTTTTTTSKPKTTTGDPDQDETEAPQKLRKSTRKPKRPVVRTRKSLTDRLFIPHTNDRSRSTSTSTSTTTTSPPADSSLTVRMVTNRFSTQRANPYLRSTLRSATLPPPASSSRNALRLTPTSTTSTTTTTTPRRLADFDSFSDNEALNENEEINKSLAKSSSPSSSSSIASRRWDGDELFNPFKEIERYEPVRLNAKRNRRSIYNLFVNN